MQAFIEVLGQAQYEEQVCKYQTTLDLTVRASNQEAALREVLALKNQCVLALLANGLAQHEVSEGGGELWQPWYLKKKPGQEASHRLLLTSTDLNQIFKATAALEPLFENQRFSLSVHMRSPEFAADEEDKNAAMAKAIDHARAKALILAKQAGVELAQVLEIEELAKQTGGSGMHGDHGWYAAAMCAGGAAGGDDEEAAPALDKARRPVSLKFRVRFAIAAAH